MARRKNESHNNKINCPDRDFLNTVKNERAKNTESGPETVKSCETP